MRASEKAYYEKHKEEIKARSREYKKARRAHYTELQKAWAKANPETAKSIDKKTREKNRAKRSDRNKEWYRNNADRLKAKSKARFAANKPSALVKQKAYNARNKARITMLSKRRQPIVNARRRERCKVDENFRLRSTIGSRISNLISQRRAIKSANTMNLIGCDLQFLRSYLEVRFLAGMSWANYGEWHIDHRIPCARFDLREPEQQRQAFHYSNLQPMWGLENIAKGDKMPGVHQAELV